PKDKYNFILSSYDDIIVMHQNIGFISSKWQAYMTTAGMIAVINSVIAGVFSGILLKRLLAYVLILNGAFMDNIGTPYMPQFDFDNGVFQYWGDGETQLDFTTTDDTAKFVAEAVTAPDLAYTALEVAGEVLTMKHLLAAYEEATGKKLQEKKLGSVEDLKAWIEQKKPEANSPVEYVPQQYEYAMVSGKGKLDNIQNARYPHIKPLTVKQYLQTIDL
ncbi:MAG: NmrA family NAD(P)-binding protein, partial [Microcystaceae cyanobacterium]